MTLRSGCCAPLRNDPRPLQCVCMLVSLLCAMWSRVDLCALPKYKKSYKARNLLLQQPSTRVGRPTDTNREC